MNDLERARQTINEVDREMVRLFEKRMEASKIVADYKKENGLPIRVPEREKEVLQRNSALLTQEEFAPYYLRFQRQVIDLSCQYQEKLLSGMKIAYCGAEGAFAQIAAQRLFPSAAYVPFTSFVDAYQSVEAGTCDCAVLPLENSYAGEVGTVLDLLFSGDLFITQIADLAIEHCLLGVPGGSVDQIQRVISHPQALHQCGAYIRSHGWETEEDDNTALAAQKVAAAGDPTAAAIASRETAAVFGLNILENNINDSRNNTTRFAVFAPYLVTPTGKNNGFSLTFTVRNAAGALAQTLNIIDMHGYNMRSLRSRPVKDEQWEYYFYLELEGSVDNDNGRAMLRELSALSERLRLVGAYPMEQTL